MDDFIKPNDNKIFEETPDNGISKAAQENNNESKSAQPNNPADIVLFNNTLNGPAAVFVASKGTAVHDGQKKASAGAVVGIIIVCLLAVGIICAFLISHNVSEKTKALANAILQKPSETTSVEPHNANPEVVIPEFSQAPKPKEADNYATADGEYTSVGIAKEVMPSIVEIRTYGEKGLFEPIAQGSGIIISDDGVIITNHHLVQGAVKIKVVTMDGTELLASIIGAEFDADIAIIKVNSEEPLNPATLGDSSDLELGEDVMALGNPLGLTSSISKGIVSALGRTIVEDTGAELETIQVDAAINVGSSGGALVNMYGQVVGVIVAKATGNSAEGIGFAIPINDAIEVISSYIENGTPRQQVRIGITYYGMPPVSGAEDEVVGLVVEEISQDCDVSNTDLMQYDIITHINDVKVYDAATVKQVLKGLKPGDTITMRIKRMTVITDVFEEFTITFKVEAK